MPATFSGVFRWAGLDAVAYERSLFCAEAGNWPDLRQEETIESRTHGQSEHHMCAWCHGAAGIGLARLASLPHLADESVRQEFLQDIRVAVQATLAGGFGGNHSLCHGDLGNLEFLLAASEALADSSLRKRVDRLASGVLETIRERGWICGLRDGAEPPGLMLGLAGIGHTLLRFAFPGRLASPLLLD